MASKSKSGLSAFQREKFLRDYGFVFVRAGKGSHQVWENKSIEALAARVNLFVPESIRPPSAGLEPWQMVLNLDPAMGTWRAVKKYIGWCMATLAQEKIREELGIGGASIKHEFNRKAADYNQWKKNIKHAFKAKTRLPVDEMPVSYVELLELKEAVVLRKQTLQAFGLK